MALYFITGSKNKFAEIKAVVPEVEQLEIDLPEIQSLDSHEVLRTKLEEARKHHDGAFIVEDTSVTFDGMNGLPGPLIKWFVDSIGNEGLVKLAKTFGSGTTTKTIIGYANEAGEVTFFEGEMRGTIVEPRGDTDGFGWNPIFMPEGYDRTFGEMSFEEKSNINMRAQAAQKLKAFLDSK